MVESGVHYSEVVFKSEWNISHTTRAAESPLDSTAVADGVVRKAEMVISRGHALACAPRLSVAARTEG